MGRVLKSRGVKAWRPPELIPPGGEPDAPNSNETALTLRTIERELIAAKRQLDSSIRRVMALLDAESARRPDGGPGRPRSGDS